MLTVRTLILPQNEEFARGIFPLLMRKKHPYTVKLRGDKQNYTKYLSITQGSCRKYGNIPQENRQIANILTKKSYNILCNTTLRNGNKFGKMRASKSVPVSQGCPATGCGMGKRSPANSRSGPWSVRGPLWSCAGAESKLVGLKAVAAFGTPK